MGAFPFLCGCRFVFVCGLAAPHPAHPRVWHLVFGIHARALPGMRSWCQYLAARPSAEAVGAAHGRGAPCLLWASGLARCLLHAHTGSWKVVDPHCPVYILGVQGMPPPKPFLPPRHEPWWAGGIPVRGWEPEPPKAAGQALDRGCFLPRAVPGPHLCLLLSADGRAALAPTAGLAWRGCGA